jgi:hypothetical protein
MAIPGEVLKVIVMNLAVSVSWFVFGSLLGLTNVPSPLYVLRTMPHPCVCQTDAILNKEVDYSRNPTQFSVKSYYFSSCAKVTHHADLPAPPEGSPHVYGRVYLVSWPFVSLIFHAHDYIVIGQRKDPTKMIQTVKGMSNFSSIRLGDDRQVALSNLMT